MIISFVISMFCKLYIFRTCSKMLVIFAFKVFVVSPLIKSLNSPISNFYFIFFLFVCKPYKSCLSYIIIQIFQDTVTMFVTYSYLIYFATIISYFCWSVNVMSCICKLHIFWTCSNTYTIFIFEAF